MSSYTQLESALSKLSLATDAEGILWMEGPYTNGSLLRLGYQPVLRSRSPFSS